jgi:phytoene synthase
MLAEPLKNVRPVSPDDLTYVRGLVQRSGSSFYWAMRFLPQIKMDSLFAIYAFCREVDDIADGDAPVAEKIAELAAWRRRIDDLFAGAPDHAITRALAEARKRFELKRADFDAVIDGMEMDARGPIVAPTLAVLDLYCDRVASAVGRLCVGVFGEPTPAGAKVSDRLGRALQLTNILRDVAEDAAIGRLYLPAELLAEAGIPVTSPRDVANHPNIRRALAPLGEMAQEAFTQAEQALAACNREAMRPAVIMMKVYYRNLVRLRAANWPVVHRAGTLSRLFRRAEKLGVALYYGLV